MTHTATFDGTFHLNGKFDAAGGGTLAAAINAYMTPDPPDTPPDQQREIEQRRADALVAMAQAALAAKEAGTVGGARPRMVVRVNLADLISHPDHPDHHRLPGRMRNVSPPTIDWVGPIGRRLLTQLLDDCEIARIVFDTDGQPIDIGRATRIWPAGTRRAIIERDRGCRFPTCDRAARVVRHRPHPAVGRRRTHRRLERTAPVPTPHPRGSMTTSAPCWTPPTPLPTTPRTATATPRHPTENPALLSRARSDRRRARPSSQSQGDAAACNPYGGTR